MVDSEPVDDADVGHESVSSGTVVDERRGRDMRMTAVIDQGIQRGGPRSRAKETVFDLQYCGSIAPVLDAVHLQASLAASKAMQRGEGPLSVPVPDSVRGLRFALKPKSNPL